MKIFRVGGCVRDALLGLPIKDIDYVVVGTTPDQMKAAGFMPVGKDFPVFLHPTTQAEYALARTERKSAPGYHGFVFHTSPNVTLEEDLLRRDLTINAMAIEEGGSTIIDPFGGQQDLANKIFRHVSDAFVEDPVRILRVARFAARFTQFTVATETMQLMQNMVKNGEVDALVPERVWQEIARGLMEQQPSRMFDVLRQSHALARIAPELDEMFSRQASMNPTVDYAAQLNLSLAVRWAAMFAAGAVSFSSPLKMPTEVSALARLAVQEKTHVEQALSLPPESIVALLERCDAFRRPDRFMQMIQALRCVHYESLHFLPQAYLEQALMAAQSISTGEIAKTVMEQFPNEPQRIAMAISEARMNAIKI